MHVWVFQGNLGEGKTSAASILAHYFRNKAKKRNKDIKLFSNFGLTGAEYLQTYEDFYKCASCRDGVIVLLDEGQVSLDSRMFSKGANIYLTQFVFYFRKLGGGMSLFLMTPNIGNLDLRVRNLANILVDCHKTKKGFSYEIYDYQAGKLLKKLFLPMPVAKKIFNEGLYNTYQLIKAIEFPKTDREFDNFLNKIMDCQDNAERQVQLLDGHSMYM